METHEHSHNGLSNDAFSLFIYYFNFSSVAAYDLFDASVLCWNVWVFTFLTAKLSIVLLFCSFLHVIFKMWFLFFIGISHTISMWNKKSINNSNITPKHQAKTKFKTNDIACVWKCQNYCLKMNRIMVFPWKSH